MDPRDVQAIERLLAGHPELKRLWDEHLSIEEELSRLDTHRFLTPEETMRRKSLQKAKLVGRDRIQVIIDSSR